MSSANSPPAVPHGALVGAQLLVRQGFLGGPNERTQPVLMVQGFAAPQPHFSQSGYVTTADSFR